jgi:excisionase family DNA binding protein
VSLQISWKRDQLSAHKEYQSHSRDFVRRVNASQAANCAENKWLPAKVEKVTEQDLYTIDQACAQLAISRATLYRLIDEKQIARIKIGKSARISRQALERFVSARTQEVYDAWN